jgi:hypothetical protein
LEGKEHEKEKELGSNQRVSKNSDIQKWEQHKETNRSIKVRMENVIRSIWKGASKVKGSGSWDQIKRSVKAR